MQPLAMQDYNRILEFWVVFEWNKLSAQTNFYASYALPYSPIVSQPAVHTHNEFITIGIPIIMYYFAWADQREK